MPPIPDKQLEERILTAARRLWREHGEKGFTLRGVARAAGTTTPTVYKRFRNKEAIRQALALRIRTELTAELFASSKIVEVYRRYLAYLEANPQEYELFRLTGPQMFAQGQRPARVWVLAQVGASFGGKPEDYGQIVDAMFLLCHGAAALITVEGEAVTRDAIRETCIKFCDQLIEHIETLRSWD